MVQSPQLKIKVNAVHAGLSPQLVLLKVLGKSRLVNSFHSLNNNLLTVLRPAKVATVVGNLVLLSIMKATTHSQKHLTHTPPLMEPVLTTLVMHTPTFKF
jgi:hypothetical protein